MRSLIAVLVALSFAALIPQNAGAQSVDRPLLSLARLNVAAGANYNWVSMADAASPKLAIGDQWSVGLAGAYNLLAPPTDFKGVTLSLVGGTYLWLDSDNSSRRFFQNYVGIRVGVYDGSRR